MAVDTRDKRGSVVGIGLAFGRLFPENDADLASIGDRQQMAYSYASNDVAAAVLVRVSGIRLFLVHPS